MIRVGLVDDHTILREILANQLDQGNDIIVNFQAANGIEMINKLNICIKESMPEIIVLDITMPEMNGFEAADWLKKNHPEIKIIILTMHEDAASILRMFNFGVSSYLTKKNSSKELITAIETVNKGARYFPYEVYNHILDDLQKKDRRENYVVNSLSRREIEFIELLCSQLTMKEIANRMSVSERTVDSFRESVYKKINVENRVGLVLYAIKNGIYEV